MKRNLFFILIATTPLLFVVGYFVYIAKVPCKTELDIPKLILKTERLPTEVKQVKNTALEQLGNTVGSVIETITGVYYYGTRKEQMTQDIQKQ